MESIRIHSIRAVYQDLVLGGVGVNNVQSIVETVLKNIAGIEADCLPGPTFARLMISLLSVFHNKNIYSTSLSRDTR